MEELTNDEQKKGNRKRKDKPGTQVIDLNNQSQTDQSTLQEDETKSRLDLISSPESPCEAAIGSVNSPNISDNNKNNSEHPKKFSDIINELKSLVTMAKQHPANIQELKLSVGDIEKWQELIDELKKKLTGVKDATLMFSDRNEMQQNNSLNLSDDDITEVDESKKPKGSDAEPMQFPDLNSMKPAVLTSLSKCTTSSPLPHGLAENLLNYIFCFCVGYQECSLIVIDQFTSSEKEQLEKDLLVAIPHLETNLSDTYNSLGGESVADFRRVRSGLQFLQDEIVSKLNSLELNAKMTGLLQSEFIKKIDCQLTSWKEKCKWNTSELLDLQFIPPTHYWYLEKKQVEITAPDVMSPKTEMKAAEESLMEDAKKQYEEKRNAAKESLVKLKNSLVAQRQSRAPEAKIRETKLKIAEQHTTIEKIQLDFIGANRRQLDAYKKDLEQCIQQIIDASAVDNKENVELKSNKTVFEEKIQQYTTIIEQKQQQFLDDKGAAMKNEGAKKKYLKFLESTRKTLGKNTLINQNDQIIRAVISENVKEIFELLAKTKLTISFAGREDITQYFTSSNRVGALLIIGVWDYEKSNSQMSSLDGVMADVAKLDSVFYKLGWNVEISLNESAEVRILIS
ncbi:hypothetical protein WR25_13056 isoform D [Diploscapter pachys]|uniref:Uncharacterized protein n=1 Tax=Diploscapter pachys TaxID=2018661 RepID=A0A2A2L2H3_9BILA|nr:hypothetical protein WR25_13056 isoform C [Diploscapter pachys]PAV80339.1 hypothetical protein WR25_13056 isoform D [Diploscapter pachys]